MTIGQVTISAADWLASRVTDRVALMAAGLMFAAPGGGLMPLSPLEMTLAAAVVALPALALALFLCRRTPVRAGVPAGRA